MFTCVLRWTHWRKGRISLLLFCPIDERLFQLHDNIQKLWTVWQSVKANQTKKKKTQECWDFTPQSNKHETWKYGDQLSDNYHAFFLTFCLIKKNLMKNCCSRYIKATAFTSVIQKHLDLRPAVWSKICGWQGNRRVLCVTKLVHF